MSLICRPVGKKRHKSNCRCQQRLRLFSLKRFGFFQIAIQSSRMMLKDQIFLDERGVSVVISIRVVRAREELVVQ